MEPNDTNPPEMREKIVPPLFSPEESTPKSESVGNPPPLTNLTKKV